MPEFWPVPGESQTLHTAQATAFRLLTAKDVFANSASQPPVYDNLAGFPVLCHVAFN